MAFTATAMPSTLFARLGGSGPGYTSLALVKQAIRSYVEQVAGSWARYAAEPDEGHFDVTRPAIELELTESQRGVAMTAPELNADEDGLHPAQISYVQFDVSVAFSTISAEAGYDAGQFVSLFRQRADVHPALDQLRALGISRLKMGDVQALDFDSNGGTFSRRQFNIPFTLRVRFVDTDTALEWVDSVSYADETET